MEVFFTNKKITNSQLLIIQNLKTLNINFSVSLYETLFLLMRNLKDEKAIYESLKHMND
jgi:hypothetical protein